MIPPFAPEGGLPLVLARFASVAGLVLAAGSLVYARLLRPAGLPAALAIRLRLLCWRAIVVALAGALLWLGAQTADLAGSIGPAAWWAVLHGTLFGQLAAARVALLLLAGAALWLGWDAGAAAVGCLALLLQAGHSHAMAMGGSPVLLASSAAHLLAACIWLGGLPGLWLTMAAGPPGLWPAAARRFSVAGLACVGVLLATAALQFHRLVVDIPGLVGTAYGWVAGVKIVLFSALIVLAARNLWLITPGLPASEAARRLRRAIVAELSLGLAVLAAACVLTELQPAMHSQALWPFAVVPSLAAVREDADIARETMLAGGAIGLSLAVLAGAAVLRRRRWPALLAALCACSTLAAAAPHLSPLLVPAVPTQFYRSTSGFTVGSIVQGAALYPGHCAACHGGSGHGDGALARTRTVPPADLTAAHLWMHSDGELFWWLTHGMEAPRGGLAMPGFPELSAAERWSLIDFIRARNAGDTLGPAGWGTQVMAPDFAIDCPNAAMLSDLRGGIVRLVLMPPDVSGAATVIVSSGASGARLCHADDASIPAAYAIVAPGARSVLIDANGWLRAMSAGSTPLDGRLATPPLPQDRAADAMDTMPGMKM